MKKFFAFVLGCGLAINAFSADGTHDPSATPSKSTRLDGSEIACDKYTGNDCSSLKGTERHACLKCTRSERPRDR